jgi:hypothetical protein
MTVSEAQQHINLMVKHTKGGGAKHMIPATLISVSSKGMAIIIPAKHRHPEKVDVKNIRPWKGGNHFLETVRENRQLSTSARS